MYGINTYPFTHAAHLVYHTLFIVQNINTFLNDYTTSYYYEDLWNQLQVSDEVLSIENDRLNRSDIQRKVVSACIVSTPAFRSAYPKRAAHACSVRMGSTLDKGEYEAFRIGGVLQRRTLKWKLRMYTVFHHLFKRSPISSEWTLTIWNETWSLERQVSIGSNQYWNKVNQTKWHWQVHCALSWNA